MDKGGFFLVYRGVFPDFGDAPYTEREAWLWLIASAGYYDNNMGQINASYSELAKAWRWTCGERKRPSPNRVRRFLDKMAKRGRILACNNTPQKLEQSCNNLVTTNICITICNYAKYQRKENGLVTILEQSCNNSKKICNNDPTFVESSQVDTAPKQKRNKETKKESTKKPKTISEVQACIDTIDLASFRDEYGVSFINNLFIEFSETCLEGSAKKPRPNPYDYVDFTKGFRTWIKKRVDKLPNKPNSDSFLDEVKKEAEKLKQLKERTSK